MHHPSSSYRSNHPATVQKQQISLSAAAAVVVPPAKEQQDRAVTIRSVVVHHQTTTPEGGNTTTTPTVEEEPSRTLKSDRMTPLLSSLNCIALAATRISIRRPPKKPMKHRRRKIVDLHSFPRLASFFLLFLLLHLIARIEGSSRDLIDITPVSSVGGFVDTTTCYTSLTLADRDGSEGLSREEYVIFLRLMSPGGLLSELDTFIALPLLLQSNYYLLACLCSSRGGDDNCCIGDKAIIDIAGAGPQGTTITDVEESFLFTVCWLTSSTIDRVIDDMGGLPPTSLPSLAPSQISPSDEPTIPPSMNTTSPSQTSSTPTFVESEVPSSEPTISPTLEDSGEPSEQPSETPSEQPSETPSEQPSETPSEQPSETPSEQPSLSPSTTSSTPPSLSSSFPSQAPTVVGPDSVVVPPGTTPSPSTQVPPTPTSFPTLEDGSLTTISPSTGTISPSLETSSSPETIPTMTIPPTLIGSLPTQFPSLSPVTSAPTPTPAPTTTPSESNGGSTEAPVTITTPPPTTSTTPPGLVDAVGRATYSIVVVNGKVEDIPSSKYLNDLIQAMDIVAVEVAEQVDEIFGTRRLRTKRRKLSILVDLPTSIDGIIDAGGFTTDPTLVDGIYTLGACPAELGNPDSDRCEEVTASISLVSMGRDPIEVQVVFEAELTDAILNGRLQDALDMVNPDSVVKILSGREVTGLSGGGGSGGQETDSPIVPPIVQAPGGDEGTGGLSTGATIGTAIGVAAVACLLASFCLLSGRKRDNKEDREEIESVQDEAGLDLDLADNSKFSEREKLNSGYFHSPGSSSSLQQKKVGPSPLPPVPRRHTSSNPQAQRSSDAGSIGSKKDSYSKSSPHSKSSPGGISHENSSGWSDVYASSMGSMESDDIMPGTEFVDLQDDGVALQPQEHNAGITNMEDLQNAITAGDWAAVGASAALMASSQYDSGASKSESQSKSKSSFSNFSSVKSNTSSWNTGLDPKKAAELDNLIESGNWEAVIQAAAQFEAEANSEVPTKAEGSDSDDGRSRSSGRSSGSSTSGSQPSSVHHSSTGGPSMSTVSVDTAKQKSREEIRAEVRDLVERVVPEELDHVDEMMAQFLGREEELLETLRTMQERDVAQKSRRAEQHRAKLEASDRAERDSRRLAAIEAHHARAAAQQQQSHDESPSDTTGTGSSGAVANASSIQSDRTDDAANLLTSASSSSDDRTRHRNALYAAIDAGKWDAVGEAAAILSDKDGSQLRATFESSRSGSTSDTRMRSRREEMTEMIEQGDWIGVVVAASRYSEEDTRASAGMTLNVREQQLQEEKEARRQAALWMEIAKQSKAVGEESEDDAGAVDATDWAIAQSLKRLEKESRNFKEGWDEGGDESNDESRSRDESI